MNFTFTIKIWPLCTVLPPRVVRSQVTVPAILKISVPSFGHLTEFCVGSYFWVVFRNFVCCMFFPCFSLCISDFNYSSVSVFVFNRDLWWRCLWLIGTVILLFVINRDLWCCCLWLIGTVILLFVINRDLLCHYLWLTGLWCRCLCLIGTFDAIVCD